MMTRDKDRQVRAAVTTFETREDQNRLHIEGYFSVFDSIVRENTPDVPTSLLDGQIEMIKKFLTSNTVGDVIDVNENGSHITISIE